MDTISEINKKLKRQYGLDLDGQPRFRVVWTTDQIEKRIGTFEEGKKVIEVPKYSYCPDRYVMEMHTPLNSPELADKMGYEPLYVFQDGDGNYLPPLWIVAEIVAQNIINRKVKPRNEKQDMYEEELALQKEVKQNRQLLDDRGTTDLDWQPHIFVPEKKNE